jgi:ferrous-iron efflux pump FieF
MTTGHSSTDTESRQQHKERWLLIAGYSSVAVAGFLIILKISVWLYTGSVSLLGSLLDSVMDSMASLLSMFALRYSVKPADEDHRFGHGKAESLAALAQSGFIFGSSLLLLLLCVERALHPEQQLMEHSLTGVWVMLMAMALTLMLVLLQAHVVRLTGSDAVRADSLHYKSDLLMNVGVIMALLLAGQGFPEADLIFGLMIAVYMGRGALQIGSSSMARLMDKELEPELDRRILEIARNHEGVLGVHDLRTRRSGMNYVIQLHLEIADQTPLVDAHRIADGVENALHEDFPGADIIIHQDPASIVELERAGRP